MVLEFTVDITRRVKPSRNTGQTPQKAIMKSGSVQRNFGTLRKIVKLVVLRVELFELAPGNNTTKQELRQVWEQELETMGWSTHGNQT